MAHHTACSGALAVLAGALALPLLTSCQRTADNALPGTLERDRVELVADAAEAIIELRVREGQIVHRGDVLLVQDRSVAADQLARGSAQSAQAQAQLDELRSGARSTTVRAAQARRDRARVQRDAEERERRRLLGPVAQNLVSRAAYDRQSAAAAAAAAALAEAEAALQELQQGTRREQVTQAQRVLEQAQAQQRELQTTAGRLEVRAPLDAVVDALPYRVGEKPARGATVAVLLASGAAFVRVHVPEPLRVRVRVGTAASVSVDGVAEALSGRVRYVSTEPEFTPYFSLTEQDRSRLSYAAEVLLSGAAAASLPAGIPATVRLQLDATP